MKNFLLLLLFGLLAATAHSQAVSWELSAEPGDQANSPGTNGSPNFTNSGLTRGAGVAATTGAGSMNSSGWFSGATPTTLADAIAGNDYYEFTINTINCLFFNPTTINIVLRSSATGPNTATLRCSSDGFSTDIGTVAVTTTSIERTFSEVISPNSSSVTYRLYGYGAAAGGGTPSAGGTMRIGTSVVASDNDIKVFATSTLLTLTNVPNITVNDGDAVLATVFAANVPGAVFSWSSTNEPIGLPANSGTGSIPSFTATNNTGAPLTRTFSAVATVNNCNSAPIQFSITVNPATSSCEIIGFSFANISQCSDNATPSDGSDDFFTVDVDVLYSNSTNGDSLILTGGDLFFRRTMLAQVGTNLTSTFTFVRFQADGQAVDFTGQVGTFGNIHCSLPGTGPAVNSCSSGGGVCDITDIDASNQGPCNSNTGDPNDDFFTLDVTVFFENPPSTGDLHLTGGDLVPGGGATSVPVANLVGNSHTFIGVRYRADGQSTGLAAIFSVDGACSFAFGSFIEVDPCPCDMIDVEGVNQGACNDNDTPTDPTDDFFTLDVLVTFENPPSSGDLKLTGGDLVPGGGATSVPVANLVGNSHTFIGVRYRADGQSTGLAAIFSVDGACSFAFGSPIEVEPCSFLPPVLTCPPPAAVSCFNNVPPVDPASVSETHDCPGNVTITHFNDINSNATCPNRLTLTRTYQGTDECGQTATCSQTITINDQTKPTMTCPISVTVSCASQVPPANINSVTNVGDNCGGTVTVTNFPADAISNQTCANRFTILRSYFAVDACGNSNNCTQTITVNDQTGPTLTCPPPQTISCAEQVPAPNPALVTGSDNCGGTITPSFFSSTISNQTCANRFTLTRQYRASDVCGNTSSCNQIITVNDQTPPAFTFVPANVTVDCYLIPTLGNPTASDNCTSGASVSYLGEVKTPGVCPVIFTLTRTWRATDVCGNSSTATQVITVTDTKAPQFLVLPKDNLVECSANNEDDLQNYFNSRGGAQVDDCTPITYSQVELSHTDGCGNTFSKEIRFVATDQCGNSAYRDATFTVADQTPPQFSTPPQNVEIECDHTDDNGESALFEWLENNAWLFVEDNCGGVVLEKLQVSEYAGCGNTWRKTYEFRAKDECGNLSKTTATFAVVDNTPPTLTCPPNENVFLPCAADVPAADPSALSASDCNGVALTLKDTWTNGTGCPGWMMTVAYRYAATDACGNEAICEQAFYVEETDSPTLICPDTIELVCLNDIPGPLQLFGYIKTQLVGNCAGGFTSIAILSDSGQPQNGATHRTYTFTAKNHCGKVTSACSVTFNATGICNQLCTASQGSWGDPNGTIGGTATADALQLLLTEYGSVAAGGGNHKVWASDAACVQEMLFGSGTCAFLPTGQFTCPLPAPLANPDGSLNNQLAANAMALQLNIWYNLEFNNRDLGGQDLHNLPPCLVEFALLKDLAQNSTVQDLLNLSNQYLQGFVGNYSEDLPAMLNSALDNLNHFREDCGLNAPCERPGHGRSEGAMGSSHSTRLFPNPTADVAILEFWVENAETFGLKIADVRGVQIAHKIEAGKGLNRIDLNLAELPSGIYLLTLQGKDRVESLRIAKVDR